ncbi:hypothetical protein GCM10011404_04470 [Sphingomonas prati]|nr:hypothetical protein GCM10011404_04470 [Sphingomonas prati]
MTTQPHIIERAYQIARLGKCRDVDDISRTLMREGYDGVSQHLSGKGFRQTLRHLLADARCPPAGASTSAG